jgi:hypothetical protein
MNWFNKEKEELDDINPYELDWGLITVDGNNEGFSTHVINSDLTNTDCEAKTKSLVLNKYRYYKIHLPAGSIQKFIFDIRGQNISDKRIKSFKNDLYTLIEQNKSELKLKIEFLR